LHAVFVARLDFSRVSFIGNIVHLSYKHNSQAIDQAIIIQFKKAIIQDEHPIPTLSIQERGKGVSKDDSISDALI
jgi:hypothetical protein